MNEEIYFKGFWLIGLGVGGGATCFREWDAKLIQLLISICGCISSERWLRAWRPLCAGCRTNVQGLTAPAVRNWPQKKGVRLFCFSALGSQVPSLRSQVSGSPCCAQFCRTLHFRIHTAVKSLNVLHSSRTCPQHAREPCQSRDGTFVVACLRLVSVQPVVVSRLWALAVEVGLCKTRGRCSLLLHRSSQRGEGHHALPDPPFAEDSVVCSLWDGCAEQRTSAPTMGTTGPAAWSCLRHDNSWQWFLSLGTCESAGKKKTLKWAV